MKEDDHREVMKNVKFNLEMVRRLWYLEKGGNGSHRSFFWTSNATVTCMPIFRESQVFHNIIRYFHIYHSDIAEHVKEMTPSEARRVQTPVETYDLHQSLRILNWSSAMRRIAWPGVCSNPKAWINAAPSARKSESYGTYGKRKTGSMQPNMASIVFKPIGFGCANNHFISGRSRSRSSGFGPLLIRSFIKPGTTLLVTDITPTAPASYLAACASSSFPVQHTIPSSVYALMRSLPSHSLTPAKFSCLASSCMISGEISCEVRAGTLYTIAGPKSITAWKCWRIPADEVLP